MPKDLTDTLADIDAHGGDPYATSDLVSTPDDHHEAAIPRLRASVVREDYRKAQRGDIKAVPVPWASVAEKLTGGGFGPRSTTVLVGGTGSGKTQWCVQVAMHAAERAHPVLYIALEADEAELVARCHAVLDPRLYWGRIVSGDALPADEADARLEALPFHAVYPEPRRFTATALEHLLVGHLQPLYSEYPAQTPLVVVDFLQLVGTEAGERKDLRERVSDVAYAARDLARKTSVAMLLVSSTARENLATITASDEAGKPRQKLGEGDPYRLVGLGKETGDIENSATAVLVLGRTGYSEDGDPSPMILAIAKQRAGRGSWVPLTFDGRTFTEPERRAAGVALSVNRPKAAR